MELPMMAVEMMGTVDEERHLYLDETLPIPGPARVRVLVLFPPEAEERDESLWLRAGAKNPVFAFLEDPEEDIYTMTDGKPFYDQG